MTTDTKPLAKTVPRNRQDALLGILGTAILGSAVFLFHSPANLILALLVLAGAVAGLSLLYYFLAYWRGYWPYIILLILPFSVEIAITETTRLTVPTEPLIGIGLLVSLYTMFRRKTIRYLESPMNRSVMWFYLLIAVSIFYSAAWTSTLKAFIRDTGYIFTAYLAFPLFIGSEERLRKFLKYSLVLHVSLIFYGFFTQALGGIRIYDKIANPFFIEHCIYAAFITISFAFLLAYSLDERSGERGFWLGLASGIAGVAILLTFVRAAWFSVALLLLFYLFQFRRNKAVVDLIVTLLLFTIGGFAVLLLTDIGEMFLQRMETIADFQYVANYDRIDRWAAAWYMFLDNMFFGVGWGAYPDIYPYYRVFENAFSSGIRMGAHNLYLEILAELGVVGFILFMAIVVLFFVHTTRLRRRVKSRFLQVFLIAMQGSMITYLFHAFLNNLGPSDKISLLFWGMLGMTGAISKMAADEEAAEAAPAETAGD